MADDARDQDAVRRTLGGEREAFRLIVERYQAPLVRFGWRMLGDRAAAEDVAQETFVKAYRALARYDVTRSFSTWIYRIAVNTCLDRKRRSREQADDALEVPVAPEHGKALEQAATARAVQEALVRLPEEYRVALVLKDVEELDYDAMSQVLGESVSALKIRVIRARQKIAKILRKLHPELVSHVVRG
jgi:RNA polymerase sigma-70 factor, ECF subfamily